MNRADLLNAKSLLASAALLIALYILAIVSEAARDELALFIESSAEVIPFVFLAVLAILGEKDTRFRPFAVLWCLLLVTVVALFTFGFGVLSISDTSEIESIPWEEASKMAGLCLLASLISLLGFLRQFRMFFTRRLSLDPKSFVHTLALVMVMAVTLLPMVPLIVTGTPPLLSPSVLQSLDEMQMEQPETIKLFAYSLFWTIFGSFMIVGLFLKRDLRQSLKRLALVLPTAAQTLIALVLALAMVVAFSVIDEGIREFWGLMGWQTTDPELVMMLFKSALTPVGALVLSITAGVGEEVAVRGVLQPRFGMIWPSLLFASLHAYQYGWDALLSVFLAGMAFAFLRKYSNTSTCAIAHAAYDLTLFMLIIAGIS